jgi:hypothetical protein
MLRPIMVLAAWCAVTPLLAQDLKSFDAAAAFGARPSVAHLRLSPDGRSVAYIAPGEGQGSVAYTLSLDPGATPKVAMRASGKPERLVYCDWVANDRLVCDAYALIKDPTLAACRT